MRLGVLAVAAGLLVAGCGSAAAPASGATPAATPAASTTHATGSARAPGSARRFAFRRVASTVTSIGGGKLVLANGQTYDITSKTRFAKLVSIPPSGLKVGDYIAITGQRQPNNSVLASLINVFPPQLNGVAPGQRPMPGGNLMTNATIAAIKGTQVDVTWKGGGARIVLAPTVKVTQMQAATAADVQAGAHVTVTYNGTAATSVTITG